MIADQSVPDRQTWISWNGNLQHQYSNLYFPSSEEEIINILKKNDSKIRVFGERKSSADIAAGTETLISLARYGEFLSIDRDQKQITVQSGISLKVFLEKIEELKWAIPCLPDIDEISLGGALSTGTHGTGRDGHLLSEYVVSMRVLNHSGNPVEIDQKNPLMEAYRLSLGLLGIISTVTFQCVSIYNLQIEERPVHDDYWLENYEELVKDHDFTRILWLPHTNHGYLITGDRCNEQTVDNTKKSPWWHKYRRTVSALLYKYTTAYPFLTVPANKIIYRLFFRADVRHRGTLYGATVTKSRGSTLELAEWTVSLEKFKEIFPELKAVLNNRSNRAYAHIPMDIRFIRSDKTWLSYAYDQDTVTVGCVSRHAAGADQYEAFSIIEEIFLKNGGRPHYAKRFKSGREELSSLYPRWGDFLSLRRKEDPSGRFLNDFLKELFL